MENICQTHLPAELEADVRLPGISPCKPDDWLRVDDAYAAQMAYRAQLLHGKADDVLWMAETARPAAEELLEQVIALLPQLGFAVRGDTVTCPDGRVVTLAQCDPLRTLGHLVQEDLCLLQPGKGEHVLSAAVLCFPANWRLCEKAGRPLMAIHAPVDEYDDDLGRRVQRMFDGVQVDKPLRRHNRLHYVDSDLHQPYRRNTQGTFKYTRSERQCVVRLPRTRAVVFSIHTWVVPM